MADKQSLYELLGLGDKASPEDIQRAFAAMRQALEAEPESEERHNRLAILQDARDVLQDRRQRAGYDRRQRDRRHELAVPATAHPRWPLFALLLVAVAAYPAWRYFGTAAPVASAPVTVAAKASTSLPPAAVPEDSAAISQDIAVLLPAPAAGMPPPTAAPTVQAPAPQLTQKLVVSFPDGGMLDKFSASTYLIIGAAGFGTGVAIESDKLLTNCHVIAPNVLKGPIFAINPATRERTRIVAAAFLITEDACVVHAPGLNGKPIAMGDAGQLAKGAPIHNIGFANGRLIYSSGTLLGVVNRRGQTYLVSSNYCDHGVSGGPLVDADGRLVGLTSGGPQDRSFCLSLTAETARQVLGQTLIAIDAFPPNYLSNLLRRW